ncbi:MAG: hypothetical protein KKF46_08495 [Nanoarchaeota archaeon]|nr:hypothetical protein [Nanoarchaeota archaeon]MBU1322369.1 hypothetical protein [Nanoarchaeota archaeon]MBU1598396.1 hypothetical protein [Nanoarchaeota archaeon]MBU2440773.1 hypothetical protein [Nanoarchaeota archaeon]
MHGILTFGDSIVFGRGEKPGTGWVGRLKNYFEEQDFYHAVYNMGIPGDTTSDLLARFEIESKSRIHYFHTGDKYIIMFGIGTNDARCINNPENHQTEPDKFRKNIISLISKAKKHTKNIVFIGLLPVDESITNPYEDTYFTNKLQKQYNDIIKECCKQENIEFIDLFDDWINIDYKVLLDDGLHPNSEGYEKMYEQIKEFLVEKEMIE